ncbi:hypothetical protein NL676_004693 [Syzygium grande]|nr:hypothetical protein NL676_004693 [Syzygium grande]
MAAEAAPTQVPRPRRIRRRKPELAPLSRVDPSPVDSATMKLTVKTLKGTNLDIKVQPSDTIMAVKKNIEDVQDNYPCGQQLLIHNGKVLKDETTLADNKVSGDG